MGVHCSILFFTSDSECSSYAPNTSPWTSPILTSTNRRSASRDKFDIFARELFEGTANFPGGSGSVFDYRLDPAR